MPQSHAEVRPQAPATHDPQSPASLPFKLTLLDLPTLPKSLIRQAGELLRERRDRSRRRDQPRARLPISDQLPWYRELPAEIQDLFAMRGTAPARFDRRAARVPDLWQDYLPDPFSWANSLLIHLLVVTAMVLPFALRQMMNPTPLPKKMFDLTHIVLTLPQLHGKADETHGGGGSGDHTPLPASRGALPPFAPKQFTPALASVPKTPPFLPMPPTLLGPPELKLPAMKLDMPWGDPSSTATQYSGGPGSGGSFGSGDGTGIGPGKGAGAGPGTRAGCCGGDFTVGTVGMDGVSAPIPIYNPEPAYSEEARKAKFQGTVLLWIVVDAQGIVRNVQIAKHLPMGLDEEAVKTVSTWKFKPAMRQGVAVPVQVEVEVSFRLF